MFYVCSLSAATVWSSLISVLTIVLSATVMLVRAGLLRDPSVPAPCFQVSDYKFALSIKYEQHYNSDIHRRCHASGAERQPITGMGEPPTGSRGRAEVYCTLRSLALWEQSNSCACFQLHVGHSVKNVQKKHKNTQMSTLTICTSRMVRQMTVSLYHF